MIKESGILETGLGISAVSKRGPAHNWEGGEQGYIFQQYVLICCQKRFHLIQANRLQAQHCRKKDELTVDKLF